MGGAYLDCYVLAAARSATTAARFLETFVPDHEFCADPRDPSEVLGVARGATIAEILLFLEGHPDRGYSLYFRNIREQEPFFAILAFNEDGSLILGLSPCHEDFEDRAQEYLRRMMAFASSPLGVMGLESAPPGTREEFLEVARGEVSDIPGR